MPYQVADVLDLGKVVIVQLQLRETVEALQIRDACEVFEAEHKALDFLVRDSPLLLFCDVRIRA